MLLVYIVLCDNIGWGVIVIYFRGLFSSTTVCKIFI